ncbi:efflux RND transporter permease subunit [Pseudalkalibacillus berkeleyi]|uniref:Efflux RND transporter permease subunit n=1 Tax=Pseudalkalibacillus berkeleyi TaxID=1069813 RepID=A0ABS9GUM7_9BACL|nr:efflux RND transporter permease subunit [Pseudalkalibacillus berkeleyi]MCF6136547.1 efflux RND transporter permease subunit [Pseudalkalibacillus berkeleyi]
MNWLTKLSLKNTVAILILTALVIGGGVLSSFQIKNETFPDVTFPVLTVQTVYPGASTEEIEENVTTPLEDSLLNLEGYEAITSTSRENMSIITILYPFGEDIDKAKTDVESAVNKIELPEDADAQTRSISSTSRPIYQVAISAEDLTKLQKDVEDNIAPMIEKIEGVSGVNIVGNQATEIEIVVDEEKAAEYGLSLSAIKDAVKQADYKLPAGTLKQEGNSIPVEIYGDIKGTKAIEEIDIPLSQQETAPNPGQQKPSAPDQQGAPSGQQGQTPRPQSVTLSEIAEVKESTERSEISRFNGEDSLLLEVSKGQDANTVDVTDEIKSVLQKAADEKDYELFPLLDQGEEVNKSLSTLLKEAGLGALFTILVILVFLRNFRATIIAIISLPISIFGTITLLDQFGYTLNIMTLGGLAVSVGRIVDDSIVVIENIYRWRQERPELTQREVVLKATKEVMGAVASSTVATLIVFLPLAIVGGILGEFFRPFALAVVFSITISLLVAIMLIPVLGKFFFKKVNHDPKPSRLATIYEKILRFTLRKKALVFVSAGLLLFGSLAMIPAIGTSFLPTEPSTKFEVEVTMPDETALEETSDMAREVEEALAEEDDIDYSQVSIGFSAEQQMPGVVQNNPENVARFFINVNEDVSVEKAMKKYEADILDIAKKQAADATAAAKEIQTEGPPAGNTVEVNLYSNDLEQLKEASTQVEELLLNEDRVKNIKNNMDDTQTKFRVGLNEEGKEANVSPYQIIQPMNERLDSVNGGKINLNGKEWDLQLTFDEQFETKEDIESFTIMTAQGEKKLSEIADIQEVDVPSSIKHQDGRISNLVTANVKGNDTPEVTKDIQADVDALSLPDGVEVEFTGGLEMITEGFADLGLAMGVAIGLVFLVLSMTFGGILTPIVILSSLIFVPIGSLTGLLISGSTLSMSAMIGLLMLIGIVVTNAVVLLDRLESNRRNGMELTEAIVEASTTRLRPILMTAFATIFALIPLASTDSASGLISKGLAITVIGGLTTSTLLTLIFVPVLYKAVGKWRKLSE